MRQCHQCKLITDVQSGKNICFYCITNGKLEKTKATLQAKEINKPKKERNGLCNEEWL